MVRAANFDTLDTVEAYRNLASGRFAWGDAARERWGMIPVVHGGAGEIEVHAYVEVSDLEEAMRFYVGGLGLRELRRLTPAWVELTGARIPIHLLVRPEPDFKAGAATLRREFGRHWTPVHLDFVVDDLQVAVDRAVMAGGTLDREIVDHHFWRMANLADPSGNGVDLIEFADGGYDAFLRRRSPDAS